MDIRNWMSGSTKRAKSAPSQEKVGPTSQGPVRNKEEEDAIIDSDEDIKPQRKKQKTTLSKVPQVFELPVNRSDEGLPSPCTFSAQAQSGKQVIVLDEVKEKRSPQKLAKKSSIENFTPVKRKCFDDMKIAVTGVPVAMSREDMEEFILSNGGKVVGSVSGKTNLLVTGSQLEDGRSVNEGMKYRAAIEKNVTIMTEEEFFAKYNSEVVRLEQQQQSAKAQITKSSMSIASSSSSGVRLEDTSLWVDKYRPRVAEDLIGHGETVRKLMDWLKSWNDVHLLKKFKPAFTKENPGARAVLLSGPPGIGKTSLSALVASVLSYDVLELNASDTRNKAEIDQILIEAVSSKAISQSAFFTSSTPLSLSRTAKNRVVIMDEVDGMGGSDRGGISELIKIIKISKIPIICICNDRQSQKVKGLANSCYDLRVKRPTKAQIAQRLIRVAAQEGLQVDVNAAEMLVEQSGNDIRQALNALQMWAISGHREMSFQDMKEGMHRIEKDKVLRQSPFDACLTILSGGKQGSFEERYNSFFIDYSLVPLLIQQNYIDSSKSGIFRNPQIDDTQKMEHLSLAADAVSDLDLVGSRIRGLDQHWELLPTQSVLSVKVGWHVQGFQAFPTFPAWLGKYSTTTKKHRLTKEIVHHTCLSIGQGFLPIRLDYIPFLRSALLNPLLKAGKDGAIKTIEMLDCYDLSKEDFSESLREMQFKLENDKILTDQYEQLDTQTKTALTRLYNSMSHKSATIAQSIGTKRAKRFAVAPLNDDFVDEDGEIILDANDGPEEEEEEEDIEALRSEMNKSLNKAKAKKATTEKKAESNARKSNKKK